jgi:hypothetical protein
VTLIIKVRLSQMEASFILEGDRMRGLSGSWEAGKLGSWEAGFHKNSSLMNYACSATASRLSNLRVSEIKGIEGIFCKNIGKPL